VARRYSEFHELHQKLRSRYTSVRGLDFPPRRVVMKFQSEFLRKRRQALERYLRGLLLLPDVCRGRDLRAFLSQSAIVGDTGKDVTDKEDRKDIMSRLYDSVADGMDDFLGNITVIDQISLAGQNLIAAATSQFTLGAQSGPVDGGIMSMATAAEAEAELSAFDDKEAEPFIKPICDIFLEVFELNRGNNWLRGRAVVMVLQQLMGGTIERKVRDNVRLLAQADVVLHYLKLAQEAISPSNNRHDEAEALGSQGEPNSALPVHTQPQKQQQARTDAEKTRTRTEASLVLATLIPELAANVVGRLNAQAASRRIFATLNNSRLK
jgi:sorting nexin-25